MRIILTVIICLAITTTTVAQKIHPKFRSENVLDRRLVDKEKGLYRVIINNGSVYYLDENYEDPNAKIKVISRKYCPIDEPYARIEIKTENNKFNIYQYSGEKGMCKYESETLLASIDSIVGIDLLFTNGKKDYSLDNNKQIIDEYILKKGDQYSFYSEPNIWYDKVLYADSPTKVIVKKDGLYGLYKGAIKFTSLKKTYNELFIGVLPNGNTVYIDKEGNEFYPRKVK